MDLAKLKEQFLVDEELDSNKLAVLVEKALEFCVVSKKGAVDIRRGGFSGPERVRLVLGSRLIASKLDSAVSPDVTAEELSKYANLPPEQVRARVKDCIDDGFAERGESGRGNYRARQHRVEGFLDSLPKPKIETKK